MSPVIFTGFRATNDLHLGNYFGALLPLVDMAKNKATDNHIYLMVADLHSVTTPINYSQLQEQILNNLRVYIAAGLPIENKQVILFRQSYVSAHSELTVLLNNFTGVGEMGRMTQFKDKSAKLSADRISVGLFDYPVLMASDILLYGSSYIPVGDDQTQHLEFARDIAQRLNNQFNQDLFVIPKPVQDQHVFFGKDQGLRIKDLADPTKKMSKSDDTGKGVIFLTDDAVTIAKKIATATTDSAGKIAYDPINQPGVSNLIQIEALLTGRDVNEVADTYKGQTQYGPLKQKVTTAVQEFIANFQTQLASVSDEAIYHKLEQSETAANQVANQTLSAVQKAAGLR